MEICLIRHELVIKGKEFPQSLFEIRIIFLTGTLGSHSRFYEYPKKDFHVICSLLDRKSVNLIESLVVVNIHISHAKVSSSNLIHGQIRKLLTGCLIDYDER